MAAFLGATAASVAAWTITHDLRCMAGCGAAWNACCWRASLEDLRREVCMAAAAVVGVACASVLSVSATPVAPAVVALRFGRQWSGLFVFPRHSLTAGAFGKAL